jgi:hypothetical protein
MLNYSAKQLFNLVLIIEILSNISKKCLLLEKTLLESMLREKSYKN